MNIEKSTSHRDGLLEHKVELSRKQKLMRRLLPLAFLAGGAAAYGITENGSPEASEHQEAFAKATVSAHATAEFGKSGTGWEHGAAEEAIQLALTEGLSRVSASSSADSNERVDYRDMIETIPVYAQADEALEMAEKDGITPDSGDKITVELDVSVDSSDNVTYKVTGAEILDIANNQE